ncbi:MAG: mechanosensitive ion channel family protein [Planctomycetota bacterium]|jgi:small conductance mechanosensitive channel
MQIAIRSGLALLLLAPVTFAQGEKAIADAALEAAKTAKLAVEQAETAAAADDKNAELEKAVDDAKAAFEKRLDELENAADAYAEKDGDITVYNEYLIAPGGRPRIDAKAAFGLVQKWTIQGKDWLVENGPGVAIKIVVFLLILLVFKFLAGIGGKAARKAITASKMSVSDLLKNFFINVIQKVIILVGLFVALEYVGAPIGPLLAGVGVLGFVVGFALQDTLANFANGIMILLYRPYDIGDVVSAGGTTGKVEAMTLVSTTFCTPDNQVVVVPNNAIWGSTITNITARDTRRCDMTIGVGYGDDLDHAETVLMDVVTAHALVLKDPEPVIKIANLGDSSVDFVVRPWCKTSDYWNVKFDLLKQIKQRLDAEGLNIPFPQRDIHVHQVEA